MPSQLNSHFDPAVAARQNQTLEKSLVSFPVVMQAPEQCLSRAGTS